MKKIILFLMITLLTFVSNVIPIQGKTVNLYSSSAIVLDSNNDQILFDKNIHTRIYPASMTKVLTALVAIEHIKNVNEKVTVTYQDIKGWAEQEAAVVGYSENEKITYLDALYGVLYKSGADACAVLANHLFGSQVNMVKAINKKASQLHMKDTHFVNITGLHDKNHYSSVYDIALALKAALKNKIFISIFKGKQVYTSTNKIHTVHSTLVSYANKGVKADLIQGAKAGYTPEANLCLASTFTYANHAIIIVSANAKTHQKNGIVKGPHIVDANTLSHNIVSNKKLITIYKKGQLIKSIPLLFRKPVKIVADKDISIFIDKDRNASEIKQDYHRRYFIFPSNKQIFGTITFTINNHIIASLNLKTNENTLYYVLLMRIICVTILFLITILLILKRKLNKKYLDK